MTKLPMPKLARAAHLSLVSCAVLIAAQGLSIERAQAQSLQDALTSAYNNNPQLLAERANLRATDENVPQALAGWRPTIQVSGSQGIEHTSSHTQNASGLAALLNGPTTANLSPQTYGLSIQQPIFRGGRTTAATEQAEDLVRAERARLVATESSILLNAITSYVNVVRDQSTVDLNINNEQVLKRQLEATQDRFHVGEVTRTDVSQAEASYAQAIANRTVAEGNLQSDRATFEHIVGFLPGRLVQPKDTPLLPTSRDESVSLASTANPNVVSAQYTQRAAEDNLRVVRSQLLPQVTLNASIQRARESGTQGRTANDEVVTANVTVPLYEAGTVYSQSRQAQETIATRRSQLDDARRAAVESAASAWEQLHSVRASIVSLTATVRSNEIALDGVQQEAAVGSRTVLDILNAEQALFQARVNLVSSQHDEVVAMFNLISAIGRLTAENLALPVQTYDPDKNYDYVHGKWFGFGTAE